MRQQRVNSPSLKTGNSPPYQGSVQWSAIHSTEGTLLLHEIVKNSSLYHHLFICRFYLPISHCTLLALVLRSCCLMTLAFALSIFQGEYCTPLLFNLQLSGSASLYQIMRAGHKGTAFPNSLTNNFLSHC